MGPKGYVRDLGLGEALARPDEEEGCVKNRHHLATQSKIKSQVRSTHQETQTHDGGVTDRTS